MNKPNSSFFEHLVSEARTQKFTGWDFSFIKDRWKTEKPTWDYQKDIAEEIGKIDSLIDIGTGGGEFLSAFETLPKTTVALERSKENARIAKRRLVNSETKILLARLTGEYPIKDSSFELAINRHAPFSPSETFRILKPGGLFITQRVGEKNKASLRKMLICGTPRKKDLPMSLFDRVEQLRKSGFQIAEVYEEFPRTNFYDVGAIIYYIKATPWNFPAFKLDNNIEQLKKIHDHIVNTGSLVINSHWCYIRAIKGEEFLAAYD